MRSNSLPVVRRSPLRLVVAVACLAAGLVATPHAASAALPPDLWSGTTADFYVAPSPLPAGDPGDVIRLQLISQTGGNTTLRMMYHSRDAAGRDRAVTGIVTYPDAAPPSGGWPVVSTANGTSGMAPKCALSRYNQPASTWGMQAVGVNTDYIGLGPVGELHPYLSRVSEAHSVIDAVRAARNIAETGAGTQWLAIGGSQGGHAAISTNELAESWAPELDLVGTVAFAPGALFDRTYGPTDEIIARVIGVMMLYGAATEHPDLIPSDYAGPQVQAASSVLSTGCLGDIAVAMAVIPADTYWTNDPRLTEPARSVMLANDVGNAASPSPLLVVQGTADMTVLVDRTRDLVDRLCTTGQLTEYTEYEGATHDNIGSIGAAQVTAWVAARFAGESPTNVCPVTESPPEETTTTTSTAPLADAAGASSDPAIAVVAATTAAATSPRFTG
jgi:hypothetical protein